MGSSTDYLRKCERRAQNKFPPLNSFRRDGWIKIVRAMDHARFGEPREVINSQTTKLDLFSRLVARVRAGEPLPDLKSIFQWPKETRK